MSSSTTDRRLGLTGGVAIKAPVRTFTTAAITLSGEQTVNSIALVTGDRCLVKNQNSSVDNGVYEVSTSSWTRSKDFDGANDVITGTVVPAYNGVGTYALFVLSTVSPVIGTSLITFETIDSVALQGLLASTADVSAGDALVGVKYEATGSAALTLHEYIEDDGSYNLMGFIPQNLKSALRDLSSTADVSAYATLALTAANGRALLVPRGRYNLESVLTYDWPSTGGTLRIVGETIGRGFAGSFFRWNGVAGGTLAKFIQANSVVLENIGFEGNELADKIVWFENAAGADSSSDIQLVNCKVSGGRRTTKSIGLQFGSSSFQVSEVTIDRCLLQTCYYGMLSFTSNVKNFRVLNGSVARNFWGIAHGSPDVAASIGGLFNTIGVTFQGNGNTPTGFFNGVAGAVDVGGDLFQHAGAIIGCESEGSARFVNGGAASVGSNYANVLIAGNQFESSDAIPSDDYVIRVLGGATLRNNKLQNGRTAGAVAKVQALGLAQIYATPTAQSQGVNSENNWYENASENAPIYDGSNQLVTSSTTFSGSARCPVKSFGDLGGTAGALVSLKAVSMDGASGLARLPHFSGNTVSTYPYEGLLSVGVNKVTINYTDLVAAATLNRLQTHVIPARTKITNVVADVTTAFAGLAGTIAMMVGDGTVDEHEYINSFDIKTVIITKGLADADLGSRLARATAVQGGWYYWTAGIVRARFDSGAGNFGNGTITNLSAGQVDVYITVERMP